MPFRTEGHHAMVTPSSEIRRPDRCPRRCRSELCCFPRVTQLDFTGPLQVFSSVPGAKVHLIWKRIEPVTSNSVMTITPTITFADCPQLDVICVPGGMGTDDMVNDEEMLAFLKQAGGRREIRHLGLHGFAGAWRRRPAEGLSRDHALVGDGSRLRRSARSRPRPASASTATASPAAASPPASISR